MNNLFLSPFNIYRIGGMEKFLRNLLTHLSKTQSIVYLTYGKTYSSKNYKGIKIIELPVRGNRILDLNKISRVVVKTMDKINFTPDVITSIYKQEFFLAATLLKILRCKWVHYDEPKGPYTFTMEPNPLKGIIRFLLEKVQRIHSPQVVVSPSRFCKKLLEMNGLKKVKVIYHGVEEIFFKSYKRGNKNFTIGFNGRLDSRNKNIKDLIEIFKDLADERKIFLKLCGSGFDKIKKIIPEELTKKLIFEGTLKFSQLPRFYNSISIFVSTSLYEGFGYSYAEALACGTPVIAYKIGALPEIVKHGKSGFLVKRGDFEEFKEKVKFLLDNPVMRKRFGKYGHKFAKKNFTIKREFKQWNELYSRVCG
jgi:glycosyltransferase involved in cell wall biosynthesis